MFDRFAEPLADPLHAVMARFRSDPRPDKVDLGVGVPLLVIVTIGATWYAGHRLRTLRLAGEE